MKYSPKIFIYAALPCEAKPLVQHFKLKKHTDVEAFAIYSNESYCLTVTGIGKSSIAAGLAYSLALFQPTQQPVLLNIGIAGHQNIKLGSIFAAEKIIDVDSGKNYYPALIADLTCPTLTIATVSKPQANYPSNVLYEMEASAFYETAIRFSTNELIQCLKIISDNQQTNLQTINAKQVSKWIANKLNIIEQVTESLLQQSRLLAVELPRDYQLCLQQWRFSSQQQQQLQALLQRRQLLIDHSLAIEEIKSYSSKQVLQILTTELDSVEFSL